MCEFMTTPLSGARRGNPDFSRDAKRQGRPFFGSFLWTSKEMNIKKFSLQVTQSLEMSSVSPDFQHKKAPEKGLGIVVSRC